MTQNTQVNTVNGSQLFYVLCLSIAAALGGFLFGFDSGVINGTVDALRSSFQSSDFGTGFSVASMLLGCAAGSFAIAPIADRWGRKPAMFVAAIFFLVSAWGSGIATSDFEFIVYRLIGGLAVGAASVLAPAYISEISPEEYRGRFASLQQMAIVLGLFAAFLSNYLLAQISGGAEALLWFDIAAWRWMYWMEIIPALLFMLAVLMIPESPRFLVLKQKDEEALKVLHKSLGARSKSVLHEIKESLKDITIPKLSDLKDEKSGKLSTLVWVGIGLSVFQQFVGINVVFYYGSVLWQAAGFSESDALWTNVISGTVNVLSTVVAIALIDRVGRRPLLLVGGVGMFLTLGSLAWIFSQAGLDESGRLMLSESKGVWALVLANLYVFSFGFSWGPCVWVLLGEMFTNRMRGIAIAIAAGVQWVANFIITLTFPPMLGSFGLGAAYGFYALCAGLSIYFVFKLVPETKGMRLEQMT